MTDEPKGPNQFAFGSVILPVIPYLSRRRSSRVTISGLGIALATKASLFRDKDVLKTILKSAPGIKPGIVLVQRPFRSLLSYTHRGGDHSQGHLPLSGKLAMVLNS